MTRVLIVDDQDLMRAGLRMILESEPDIEVVGEAADGVQAVEIVKLSRPDIVLMDIRMPGMDGIEATRRLSAALDARESSSSPHLGRTNTSMKRSERVRAGSCSRLRRPTSW